MYSTCFRNSGRYSHHRRRVYSHCLHHCLARYFHSIENFGTQGRTPGFRNHMLCRDGIRSNHHAETPPEINYPSYSEGPVSGLVAGPITLLRSMLHD
jgi:hypothetical protein